MNPEYLVSLTASNPMNYLLRVGSPPWEVVAWKLSRLSKLASAFARYKYALEYSQAPKIERMVLDELRKQELTVSRGKVRRKKEIIWSTDFGKGMVRLGLLESMLERSLSAKAQALVVNTSYASWRKHRRIYGLKVRKIYSNLESEIHSV